MSRKGWINLIKGSKNSTSMMMQINISVSFPSQKHTLLASRKALSSLMGTLFLFECED